MNLKKDYFYIAVRNLKSRTLRSWLTIFGIVIGVFLVMSLLSLSEGIKTAVLKELRMMGGDIIMVYPGESIMDTFMMSGLKLSESDIEAIKKAEGVERVIPEDWTGEVIRFAGETKTAFIYGIPFGEAKDVLISKMGWKTQEGDFPSAGKRELLIGAAVAKDVLKNVKVGDRVYISGQPFEVKGVLRSLGNQQDDSMVGMDMEIFQEITGRRKGSPFLLVVKKPGFDEEEVAENIKEKLNETRKRQRGQDLPPYSVITSQKAMDMVGSIMAIIQVGIFAIAGFAILVGAIGIMNTMYTSVRERTKEIGIMKAIGAKTSDISSIFLIESGIMGLIGGIGGTILGIGSAKLIEIGFSSNAAFALTAYVSLPLIFFGLFFTFLVGCLSGYFPARRAAKLKPIDALHYE